MVHSLKQLICLSQNHRLFCVIIFQSIRSSRSHSYIMMPLSFMAFDGHGSFQHPANAEPLPIDIFTRSGQRNRRKGNSKVCQTRENPPWAAALCSKSKKLHCFTLLQNNSPSFAVWDKTAFFSFRLECICLLSDFPLTACFQLRNIVWHMAANSKHAHSFFEITAMAKQELVY